MAAFLGSAATDPACFAGGGCAPVECDEPSCDRVVIRIDTPDGAPVAGRVHVRAQSVLNFTVGPLVRVVNADGGLVARGTSTDWLSVAVMESPPPGEYAIEVVARYGKGAYDAVVLVEAPAPAEAAAAGVRDLLPNLRTIPPYDLRIETPEGDVEREALALGGVAGCRADEAVEYRAKRCLRFSNGIANTGEGALEVAIAREDAPGTFAGLSRFVQRIARSDGSVREEPAGAAEFHHAHGHFHYAGIATYALYAYDWDARERGERVGEGRKSGFCFYDTAMLDLARADVAPQAYDGRGCFAALDLGGGEAFVTGVSPGYTDFYGWYLPDQYVDVSGLPDGVYELVSTADGDATLVESDVADNDGSAVFSLRGDEVVVLAVSGAGAS